MRSWLYPLILIGLLVFAAFSSLTRAENLGGLKTGYPGQPNVVANGDFPDQQTAAFRATLSSADTLTTAGILGTTEFNLKGRQIVKVSARFSASAATCKVRLAYVYKIDASSTASSTSTANNKIVGFSDERTLTAGTASYEAGYFPTVNGDEFFDGGGAVTLRVLITSATNSGTVDLWVGSK